MFKQTNRTYKMLRPGDMDFAFSPDGITWVRRAGFEIASHCPPEYRRVLNECLTMGWIQPVAFMKDSEYTWEKLQS